MAFNLTWKRIGLDDSGRLNLLRAAAVASWLGALAVIVQAAALNRETPADLRTCQEDLNTLGSMRNRMTEWTTAVESVARTFRADRPYDLAAQAALLTGGTETNAVQELSRVTAADNWEAVRVQVRSGNLPLAALSTLIESAEGAAPPWRLVSLAIEPVSPKAGRGRVALEFETLSPSKAPPK